MKNKRIKLKFLALVLAIAMVVSVLPMICNKRISYAATGFTPFIPDKHEKVKILDDNSGALISSDQARVIIEDLYPGLLYVYDFCFERENGEKYYAIRLKEKVDNHITTLSQYFVSFDGKVCIEGYCAGNDIIAYNNTNLTTVRDDALKAYNDMLSADKITFYTDSDAKESIEVNASNCSFAIVDINANFVPELVVFCYEETCHATGRFNLFTYANGGTQFIYNTGDEFSYIEKSGIFTWNFTGTGVSIWEYYYMEAGTSRIRKIFTKRGSDNGGMEEFAWHYYEADGSAHDGTATEISELEFKERLDYFGNGNTEQNGKFYDNNSENRDKYLIGIQEMKPPFIINAVNKYSTDNETLKKMLFYINEKDLPYDVKMQLMNDVCMRYGYTDIKEGIEYLNDANSAQIAYNALVNNEQYCCWNFGYYLNNTTKGRIAKGLLYTNGLIFNNELGAWIEPGTYIENDYPGIKKYKTLLAKFIEDRSTEFEIYTRANQVVSTIQDILKLKKLDNRLELEKKLEDLFKASSLTEQDKIIDYLFKNYELKIEDGKHVKVKSEVWGKAFGIASATLKLATDSTNDILAFFDVSTRMKLYQEYDVFFNEIIHAQDLPFELRAAAYFLQDEVKSGYFTPIRNLLLHSLKNAAKLQSSIQEGKTENAELEIENGELGSLLGDAVLTIGIGTFCVNLLVDMGGLVKNAAYTNGYAYLTAFYANLLEESRVKFNNNKTEANAWDFYYKYNMLYSLRIAGEETYLELNKLSPDGIMGWGGYLLKYAFDYDSKKNLVESNISFLKEHCKFQLPSYITVPEVYQFAKKAVISCPVDVKVFDSDGKVVAVIADGSISDISNEYGRFMSVYNPYSKDYTKVIYLKNYDDYTYQIIGKNDGMVSLQMFEDGGVVTGFRNVAIDENTIIKATDDDTIKTYEIDSNADGKTDKKEELQQEKDKMNLLTSLSISDTKCNLKIDEHKQLLYQYEPLDAVNSQVSWKTENSSIVSVTQDGEIKALSAGITTVYCISTSIDENGDNIISYCNIIVEDDKGNKPNESFLPEVSKSPTSKPIGNPSGGSSSSGTTGGGGGGFIGGGTAPVPSVTPSPNPSASPVTTSIPGQAQVPAITPEATITPLVTQAPAPTPDVTLPPSASPVTGEGNNTSSPAKLKKGLRVKDKRTKAVYKIISTGKSKTAEYAKSTKKNTADIVIPAFVKLKGKTFKVVSIGNGAFKNNKKLKSVKIGKNIKLIGKEAFSGCKKLAKVKMGKDVTSIGQKAFNNCTSLTIITIPSKVKKIGKKAFYKCKNLQYILVKTKKLKPGNIGAGAFGNGYSNPRVKLDKSVWKQYQNVFISKGLSSKALFLINPAKLVV